MAKVFRVALTCFLVLTIFLQADQYDGEEELEGVPVSQLEDTGTIEAVRNWAMWGFTAISVACGVIAIVILNNSNDNASSTAPQG